MRVQYHSTALIMLVISTALGSVTHCSAQSAPPLGYTKPGQFTISTDYTRKQP